MSIIDTGLTVDGTISSTGKLIIKGKALGTIIGETVIVAVDGEVSADIKAEHISIAGKFDGQIRASGQLGILATGNCSGKVVCNTLTVDAGGILNAQVTCIQVEDSSSGAGEDADEPALSGNEGG